MSLHLVNLTSSSDCDSELFVELFPFVFDVLFDRVLRFLFSALWVLGITPHLVLWVNGILIRMLRSLDKTDLLQYCILRCSNPHHHDHHPISVHVHMTNSSFVTILLIDFT